MDQFQRLGLRMWLYLGPRLGPECTWVQAWTWHAVWSLLGPNCNLVPNLSLTAPVPRSGPQQVRSQTWHRIKPVPRSEPQQVRSRTWHRIQHVPRPGPNCSLVPGLDPIPTCPQTWTQFGHRPGSEIGTQRFYWTHWFIPYLTDNRTKAHCA